MSARILVCSAIAVAMSVPVVAQQRPTPSSAPPQAAGVAPLRIYLRGGLKTHSPGQHVCPPFVADWSNILTECGADARAARHPEPRSRRLGACSTLRRDGC